MKKLFTFGFIITIFFGFSFACESLIFDDGNVCIDINKNGNYYTMENGLNCNSSSCSLSCNILLPDNSLVSAGSCDGGFTWNGISLGKVKAYVNLNGEQKSIFKNYSFANGYRYGNTSSSYTNLASFDFYNVSSTNPPRNTWTDIRLRALDSNGTRINNYNGTVSLIFKRDGYYADYSDITIRSDDFNKDEYDINNYGEMTVNFINGYLDIEAWFKYNDNYSIQVKDGNVVRTQNFNVGGTTNNINLDNFYLSSDDISPEQYQWVDLTIRARNGYNNTLTNYNNKVKFKVYYRASSSSYRTETTSSTYYTMNSSYTNGYNFLSSNNGQKTITDFIKFNRDDYDYKVRVYDEDDSSIYNEIIFYVSSNAESDIDGFTIKEIAILERIHNLFPQLINQLENEYSYFRTYNYWIILSNNLYSNIKDVLDDESDRKFSDYDEFFVDFQSWYTRTINVIN